MKGQINLEGVEFFAYHGFHTEERKIGNKYGIDLSMQADLGDAPLTDELSQTIDYEIIYRIIKAEIEKPTKLLEAIGKRIMDALMIEFPQISAIEVSVSKFNPPVGGICHRAKVTLKDSRINISQK